MIVPANEDVFGSVALVAYLPEPLGSFLRQLRSALPGEHNSDPHVTILPPRVLSIDIENASEHAFNVLQHFASFPVELSQVRSFPDTNILYLDVAEGESQLHRLHAALNAEQLAAAEKFHYLPHLTLGGPIVPEEMGAVTEQIESAWSSIPVETRFYVTEVVCLWQAPNELQREWRKLWTRKLEQAEGKAAHAGVTSRRY
jgi:2'-5' RNA ligase